MIATYLLIGCVVGIALACLAIVLLLERNHAQVWKEAHTPKPQKPRIVR